MNIYIFLYVLFGYFKLSLFSFVLTVDYGDIIFLHEQLELADPDFYKIGYVRSFRAYGIEFREGPDGYGVFASRDVEPLRRARVSTTLHYVYMWKVFILLKEYIALPLEAVSNSVIHQCLAVPNDELHLPPKIGLSGKKDMQKL